MKKAIGLAVALLVLASANEAPAAERSCGVLTREGRYPVVVTQGSVRCLIARRVISQFLPEHGRGEQYTRVGGRSWFCADSHGRELERGGIAHCVSGRTKVVVREAPPAPGSTRSNPLPVGRATTVNNWRVKVVRATLNANAQFESDDAPPVGKQYVLATLRATYRGTGSDELAFSVEPNAVGHAAIGYDDSTCNASVPNGLPMFDEVFTGGTLVGNVCWLVRTSDATSLVMYLGGDVLDDGPRVFFSLTP